MLWYRRETIGGARVGRQMGIVQWTLPHLGVGISPVISIIVFSIIFLIMTQSRAG